METSDVIRLGLILAVQAEIEGMKTANYQRSKLYTDDDFQAKAEELRNISYCHEQQL